MTTQKNLNNGKTALIIFIVAHAVMCYFGCIRETTKWLNMGDLLPLPVEIDYYWLCAPFVTLMTVIRLAFMWRNKAALHKFSCVLSVVVAIITSLWTTILHLSRPIYGGLTATIVDLSVVGWAAVVLAWMIVVAQIGLFHWMKKAGVFPEYTDHADKNKGTTAIWIAFVILVLLVFVVFRDPLLDLLTKMLNYGWFA